MLLGMTDSALFIRWGGAAAGRGGEPRHVLVQPLARRRADHAEPLHDDLRLGGEALEGVVDAELAQLLLVAADDEETVQVPAVRLQKRISWPAATSSATAAAPPAPPPSTATLLIPNSRPL